MDAFDDLAQIFLDEVGELLQSAESSFLAFESNPGDIKLLEGIFRIFHNIKGSSKAVGFDQLSHFAHITENLLVRIREGQVKPTQQVIDTLLGCKDALLVTVVLLKSGGRVTDELAEMTLKIEKALNQSNVNESSAEEKAPTENIKRKSLATSSSASETDTKVADDTIKLPMSKIDALLNCFGEQVILQSVLEHTKDDLIGNVDLVRKTIVNLSKVTYNLQHTAVSLRMVSLGSLFQKMARVVRDTSKALDKKIIFEKSGEETELDKMIVDSLSDPLTHMLRNSVDHGIEGGADRIIAGKSEEGRVRLDAYHRGGFFYLEITDDGKGLNKELIVKKAIEKGIISTSENMTDEQIFDLIFASGLSTKEKVTDVSGRGVGMDVVRDSITRLKGSIKVQSQLGEGTKFILQLPLTLAIFNGSIITVSGVKYVMPNSDFVETISVSPKRLRMVARHEWIFEDKGRILPIIDLNRFFSINSGSDRRISFIEDRIKKSDEMLAIITNQGNRQYAVLIDDLLAQERIVFKNLGSELEDMLGVSGATILGDGQVALILEMSEIINEMT